MSSIAGQLVTERFEFDGGRHLLRPKQRSRLRHQMRHRLAGGLRSEAVAVALHRQDEIGSQLVVTRVALESFERHRRDGILQRLVEPRGAARRRAGRQRDPGPGAGVDGGSWQLERFGSDQLRLSVAAVWLELPGVDSRRRAGRLLAVRRGFGHRCR